MIIPASQRGHECRKRLRQIMRVTGIRRVQNLAHPSNGYRSQHHGGIARDQHMHIAQLGCCGHGGQSRLPDLTAFVVEKNKSGHDQITFASLRSFSTSSATESSLMPALRSVGSATLTTVRRGVMSTPRSAACRVSSGFFLAFMMLGSEA